MPVSVISERAKQIDMAAVEALDDGRSPFEHHFLSENEVTYAEVMAFSERCALALKVLHAVTESEPRLAGTLIAAAQRIK